MDLETERWNVDFDVCKSMRYHAYRRSFWENWDNWSKGLSAFTGTAVFVSIIGGNSILALIFSAIVAILSSADLVLGFGDRTRVHDSLYRRFSRLAQDVAENLAPTEAQVSNWRRQRLEIEMDEPGTLDLLERRCSAEECKARGCDMRPAWELTRWQTLFSQWSFWPSRPSTQN